mmetsp:Transcript_96432/g.152519  ORF Transcript_96432/g.152519 Transcript_96432/m.152519 type:complete len:517 (+) Transcript_96432:53-1603(+)
MKASVDPSSAAVNHPTKLLFSGRTGENADICGEYLCLTSDKDGYPVYQNEITGIYIRYWKRLSRWIIDRSNFQETGMCVAYASAIPNRTNPASPEFMWYVWDSTIGAHVFDESAMAFDAPKSVTFVGRESTKECSAVNGKFSLVGSVHGKAAYKHDIENLIIRYNEPERRWLISQSEEDTSSNICCAWASAVDKAQHPGEITQWNFWEPGASRFELDPRAGLTNAPAVVHVLGRLPDAPNSNINGTYHLAGLHIGKPVYAQPGTQSIIRFSTTDNLWLIDCEGLQKPTLLSRLYQWAFMGDSERASDRCSAWAKADGSKHPGQASLQWHVWENQASQFKLDKLVLSTSAPLTILVSSRAGKSGSNCIMGEYRFVGFYSDRPVYQKHDSQVTMYFSKSGRWVIDCFGLRDLNVCAAYLNCKDPLEHPDARNSWYIFQSSQERFIHDPAVAVVACTDVAPSAIAPEQTHLATGASPIRGIKRGHRSENSTSNLVLTPQAKFAKAVHREEGLRPLHAFR